MSKVIRWMFRIVSLAILAGVWSVLPVMMPGPSRLLSVVHLCCLVVAVNFSVLTLLATFMPTRNQRPTALASALRGSDAEALRQAAQRAAEQKGERHE